MSNDTPEDDSELSTGRSGSGREAEDELLGACVCKVSDDFAVMDTGIHAVASNAALSGSGPKEFQETPWPVPAVRLNA